MNFSKLATAYRLREPMREAVRLVLVDGLTAYAASKLTGVTEGGISLALGKIRGNDCKCPRCGSKL